MDVKGLEETHSMALAEGAYVKKGECLAGLAELHAGDFACRWRGEDGVSHKAILIKRGDTNYPELCDRRCRPT